MTIRKKLITSMSYGIPFRGTLTLQLDCEFPGCPNDATWRVYEKGAANNTSRYYCDDHVPPSKETTS